MLKATIQKYILNFNSPAGTSRGILHQKTSWFISLFNSENPEIKGIGECSLIQGLSPDPELQYEEFLKIACNAPQQFSSLADPRFDRFPSIRFGLEMARIDLENKGKGVLFDSEFTRGSVGIPINGLIWMDSVENMFAQIRERIDEGYECIKVKIGALDFQEELNFLKRVRKEFKSNSIQLRLDANGAFNPKEAIEKLKPLSELNLHSIEQPIKPGNWNEMAALCAASPVPIALDEELFSVGPGMDKIQLLETIKPQYLVLKPSMLGGFSKCREWTELAGKRNVGWWITSALESNIGLNAIAQWTFICNNPTHHGLGTGKIFSNNLPSRLKAENGFLKYFPEKAPERGGVHDSVVAFKQSWTSGQKTFILQTSGSTGLPKEISVSRKSMIDSVKITGQALGLKKGDTALLCLPVDFVAGKMMIVRALELEMNLLTVKPSSNPLRQIAENTVIDFAAMTPMQTQESLLDHESLKKLRTIKKLIIGGAQVHGALENALQQIPGAVYETYGMTETLTHVALRPINGPEQSKYFHALPGIHFSLDHRGCLIIHAPHLDTPEVKTNDLVELINTRQFNWLGRVDNVINSSGIKIVPEQLEKKLEGFVTQRFIVTGCPDKKLGQKVVLVIEGTPVMDISAQLEKAQQLISNHEKPREIKYLNQFPETKAGKIKRGEIQKILSDQNNSLNLL